MLRSYDTGSIGAITTMPNFQQLYGVLSPTLRGFTVSFIMLTAAVTCLLAGHLADHYGHLNIVMAGALVFATGTALEAGSSSLPMLLVGRALAGFGEGLYLGNLNVYAIICHVILLVLNLSASYICEIAPKAKRGMLVSMPQLLVTAGTCIGYFTCYGSIKLESSISWRLPFIIQAVGGVLLSIFCYILPSSPRWMLLHGHRDTAMSALKRLDVSTVEIEIDILRPAEDAARSQSASTGFRGLLVIFERQHRTRTALGLFILGMVQLCGIDGILYVRGFILSQNSVSLAYCLIPCPK